MLKDIRNNYTRSRLDETDLDNNPFGLFKKWMKETIEQGEAEPTAMTLATCEHGFPDTRIVLLKEVTSEGFIFFSNYLSTKGKQIEKNNKVSLNFFWPSLERQVRIKGMAEMLNKKDSEEYFHSRPRESQIGAWASRQSTPLPDRKTLEQQYLLFQEKYRDSIIEKPDYWGGYLVSPLEIEFWQGRPGRLHDRFRYTLEHNTWTIIRLSP